MTEIKVKHLDINLRASIICYLQATTWEGLCYATHWYGRLVCGKMSRYGGISVEYTLTQKDADTLNRGDRSCCYKAGETSTRFPSRESLIEATLACWQVCFPEAKILIEGEAGTIEPQLLLAGPEHIKDRINALQAEFEALGRWDGNNIAKCEVLCDEWEHIWKTEIEPLETT